MEYHPATATDRRQGARYLSDPHGLVRVIRLLGQCLGWRRTRLSTTGGRIVYEAFASTTRPAAMWVSHLLPLGIHATVDRDLLEIGVIRTNNKTGLNRKRLLMPLSIAALTSGMMTLIASSPDISSITRCVHVASLHSVSSVGPRLAWPC
jgi:hypothetical protein